MEQDVVVSWNPSQTQDFMFRRLKINFGVGSKYFLEIYL